MSWGIRFLLAAAVTGALAANDVGIVRLAQAQTQVERADPPANAAPTTNPARAATPANPTPATGPTPIPRADAPPPPRVELFSPRGEAKQVRQVTARFSAPIVALGDPRLEDPFSISCAAPGKGR